MVLREMSLEVSSTGHEVNAEEIEGVLAEGRRELFFSAVLCEKPLPLCG
jgi:hypothetical protein